MNREKKAEISRLISEGKWLHVTGSRKNVQNTEYYVVIADLLELDEVRALADFRHHIMTTRWQHCLNVSYYNYRICRLLRLDAVSAARAGLLHDLYHYDTKRYHKGTHTLGHSSYHPMKALENAERIVEMNDRERDMIEKHMWPVTHRRPKYAETYIITLVDKYCAVIEFILPQPARLGRWIRSKTHKA